MILLGNTAALVRGFGVSNADIVLCWIARMLVVFAAAAVTVAANPALAQSTCNIPSGASLALGANSFACGPSAVVFGALGNPANPVRGTAVGDNAQVIGNDGTAVGQFSYANTSSTSLGSGSEATGTQSVAIGTGDNNNINDFTNTYGARANNGTAVGFSAIANSNATAIGHGAQATGSSSVALGIGATAANTNSVAMGDGASASGLNSVAIGANSVASASNVVSVGAVGSERRIVNVASGLIGIGSTDAVNGGQLMTANQRVAATLGAGAGLDFNGQLTAPSYSILGSTYNNVGAAFAALNSQAVYVQTNSSGAAASATGLDASAIGSNASASGANSLAFGTNSQATQSGSIAVGFNASSTGTNAIAIGTGAVATGSIGVGAGATASNGGAAFGDGAVATGANSAALGTNASATAANSVAIGSGSTNTVANTVSFGSAGNERRLTNVAAGVNATDAVNVGQLQSTVAGIQSQYAGLQNQVIDNQREARRGIVAAVAVAPVLMPSAAGKTTVAVNTGHYRGETGVGVGVSHRLNFTIPTVVYGSYANGGGNEHIGRAGMAVEF
jgi:trimeric autotransporter adhesin